MSTSLETKKRPEFRNIHVSQIVGYRLPAPGMVSIMHRVSGAVLFLLLPLLLWLFQASLQSPQPHGGLTPNRSPGPTYDWSTSGYRRRIFPNSPG